MRVATSYHSAKAVVENWTAHDVSWAEQSCGRHHSDFAWTWLLSEEKDVNTPRSWKVMSKQNPRQYLRQGVSMGYLSLKLTAKPAKGKVWSSVKVKLADVPDELVKALTEKSHKRSVANRWDGLLVDIYTPVHQKHPGLASHAAMAFLDFNGRLLAFVSDGSDPHSAPVWQSYELFPTERAAVPLMEPCEKAKQKELLLAMPGESVELRCGVAVRLSEDHAMERLGGIQTFAWTLDRSAVSSIPPMARKFKLGEVITDGERRAIPKEDLSALLAGLCGGGAAA